MSSRSQRWPPRIMTIRVWQELGAVRKTRTMPTPGRCCWQGALLLVLFQVSHTVEHKLTERATGDLRALFEGIPEAATLVTLDAAGEPDMGTQAPHRAVTVPVGATMLVKPGETVRSKRCKPGSECITLLRLKRLSCDPCLLQCAAARVPYASSSSCSSGPARRCAMTTCTPTSPRHGYWAASLQRAQLDCNCISCKCPAHSLALNRCSDGPLRSPRLHENRSSVLVCNPIGCFY